MADKCPLVCGMCGKPYTQDPPDWVRLWNGLLMPTIGFGTAGLGSGAAAAVSAALDEGYRLIDSAQAREWYREDLNAQARRLPSVSLLCEQGFCAALEAGNA